MSTNKKVILNAEELLAQSDMMKNLKEEYNSLFTGVTTILNQMNDGWSENLANNFVGKITSAQKGFSKIIEMLECGQSVAKETASSFDDVNSVLARAMTGTFAGLFGGSLLGEIITGQSDLSFTTDISTLFLTNIDKIQDVLKDVNLDKFKELEKNLFGTNTIENAEDVLNVVDATLEGRFSSDTIDSLANITDDFSAVSDLLGFTDSTGMNLIVNSAKRIVDNHNLLIDNVDKIINGEHVGGVSGTFMEGLNDWEYIQNAYSEGEYLEGTVGALYYGLENGAKILTETVVQDMIPSLADSTLRQVTYNTITLDKVYECFEQTSRVDINEVMSEIGANISNAVGDWTDEVVYSTPIVLGYAGEEISNAMSGVANVFNDAKDYLSNLF